MSGRVLWVVVFAVTLLGGCGVGTDGEFVAHVGPTFVNPDDGAEIRHTFTVRNDSTRALEIVRVRTSCNCAKAELSARQIAPGESAKLTLTYVPSRVWGTDRVSADLLFGDGSLRRYSITVQWYPQLFVRTTELEVGGVRIGSTGAAILRCKAYGSSKEDVYRFAGAESAEGLKCDLVRAEEKYISPKVYQSEQELRVTVPPGRTLGERKGTLFLTFRSGNGRAIEKSVRVRWNVTPVVEANPALAVLNIGGEQLVTLQAYDGVPFRILGCSLDPKEANAWLAVEVDERNRGVLLRDRSGSGPSESLMPRRCVVLIRIDHPKQETVRVPVFR